MNWSHFSVELILAVVQSSDDTLLFFSLSLLYGIKPSDLKLCSKPFSLWPAVLPCCHGDPDPDKQLGNGGMMDGCVNF